MIKVSYECQHLLKSVIIQDLRDPKSLRWPELSWCRCGVFGHFESKRVCMSLALASISFSLLSKEGGGRKIRGDRL